MGFAVGCAHVDPGGRALPSRTLPRFFETKKGAWSGRDNPGRVEVMFFEVGTRPDPVDHGEQAGGL